MYFVNNDEKGKVGKKQLKILIDMSDKALIRVTDVEYLQDYTMRLEFSDGVQKQKIFIRY